mmetsp:Transcript_90577/g.146581  ORF Transcript_90577/g.146581 Transcript_90577/m.146581 type:complete len:217 (+) Transcript_90577:253-903(+)
MAWRGIRIYRLRVARGSIGARPNTFFICPKATTSSPFLASVFAPVPPLPQLLAFYTAPSRPVPCRAWQSIPCSSLYRGQAAVHSALFLRALLQALPVCSSAALDMSFGLHGERAGALAACFAPLSRHPRSGAATLALPRAPRPEPLIPQPTLFLRPPVRTERQPPSPARLCVPFALSAPFSPLPPCQAQHWQRVLRVLMGCKTPSPAPNQIISCDW